MLNIPTHTRIYLCTEPTDMRKSFDGLHALAVQVLQKDPLEGHLFVFLNRRRDRVKLLWWDRDGLALFYKRLEGGTFELPSAPDSQHGIEIDPVDLALLLGGIDLRSAKRRKRYSRAA